MASAGLTGPSASDTITPMTVPLIGEQEGTLCGERYAEAAAAPATVSGESDIEAATGRPGRPDVRRRPASQETCRRRGFHGAVGAGCPDASKPAPNAPSRREDI
jgi:hypothetical protein